MIRLAFRFSGVVLLGGGLLASSACSGRQSPSQEREVPVVAGLFRARFGTAPEVRDLDYARVWHACEGAVSLRVSCSAFYDHQLGDEILAAHVGLPPDVPFVFSDERDDRRFALGRRVRYVVDHRIHEVLLVEALDTLFVVSAEGPADERSKTLAREFIESFEPILGEQCPTVKVLRLKTQDRLALEPPERVFRDCSH